MLKRLMIGLLGTSLVMLPPAAYAGRVTPGGKGWGSVDTVDILSGLGNADITLPAFEVVLFPQLVSIRCTGPAGQTGEGRNGNPFEITNASVDQTLTIDNSQITKNGKALAEIVFTDADLIASIEAANGDSLCNNSWTATEIVVHALQVFGTLFSCEEGGNQNDPRATGCLIEDAQSQQCFVPDDVTLDVLFSGTGDYNCTTLCNDPGTPCPQPPVEL